MWTLIRLPEFYKAYKAAEATFTPAEAAASLPLPKGLLVAFVLATPFWTAVGLLLHHIAR